MAVARSLEVFDSELYTQTPSISFGNALDDSLSQYLGQQLGLHWLHPGGRSATSRLLDMMDLQPWMRVLDLGCGTGATSRYIAENKGCDVLGLDRDLQQIIEAGRQTPAEYRWIQYQQGNAPDTDLQPESFDAIVMESVLWQNNKPVLLAEVSRLLKPWGQLGVIETNWLGTPSEAARDIAVNPLGSPFADSLPERGLLQLFRQAGLYNVEHEIYPLENLNWRRIINNEGLVGGIRVLRRLYDDTAARAILDELEYYLTVYPDLYGYGLYLAWKPGN